MREFSKRSSPKIHKKTGYFPKAEKGREKNNFDRRKEKAKMNFDKFGFSRSKSPEEKTTV